MADGDGREKFKATYSEFPCSIVIRAYNEEKHIERLLVGIQQQSIGEVEIILVDSGSTDRTVEIAAMYPVRIVSIQPEKFSFGYSLNRGIEVARSEIVVIASAHIYPLYPDWLSRLITPFEDPQVALTFGKQRGNEITHFSEHQIFAHWFPEYSRRQQTNPFCNNANAAIRRTLWERNHFDETLSGLEDIAWARWAIEQGYTIAYEADAEVIHVHNERPKGIYNRYRREAMAFKRIFPEERFHFWDFIRLCTSNIASDLWHATRQGRMIADFSNILWFRFMQFWGTYQGFRRSGPLTDHLRQTFFYPRGFRSLSQANIRRVEPIQYFESTSDERGK